MGKPKKYTEAEMPSPGSVFIARLQDGRYGAVLVLDRKIESRQCIVFVAPSPWICSEPVRPSDLELRKSLILTHHFFQNAEAGVWATAPPPSSFTFAGSIALTDEDRRRVRLSYSGWEYCSHQILIQWRWEHDRERLLIEEAEQTVREATERQKQAQKHAEMLRTITLSILAERRWFDHWNDDIDGLYIQPSRAIVASTIAALSEFPKITKTLARKHLKSAVIAFNQLDETTHFIETTHREDICEALELVMFASRQPDLAAEIDEWRDW